MKVEKQKSEFRNQIILMKEIGSGGICDEAFHGSGILEKWNSVIVECWVVRLGLARRI